MSEPKKETQALTPATITQAPNEIIRMGMDTVQGFEALQRAANLLSSSSIVPEQYRRWVVDKDGNRTENPSGLANCVVALNMAARMGAEAILVMQNLHVIEGRPSWSSLFVIASINQCGRFSPLRFDLSPEGAEEEVAYTYTEWADDPSRPGKRKPTDRVGKIKIKPRTCRAWAIEKATGERLEGPIVSMQMAVDEGWLQKKGSKWRTMPEVMLRYRAASFFGKLYAPELLMGLQSREELEDISGDVIDAETGEIVQVRTKAKVLPQDRPIAASFETSWEVEDLEKFSELIDDRAYSAFCAAGHKEDFETWAKDWRPKRGKGDAAPILAELEATVESFESAAKQAPEGAAPTGEQKLPGME